MHQPRHRIAQLFAGLSIATVLPIALGLAGCDEFEDQEQQLAEAPLDDPALDESPLDEPPPDGSADDLLVGESDPEHGHLDEEIIQRIVRAHLNEIKHCYDELLSEESTAAGRLEVRFSIDALGNVSNATIADGTIDDPQLRSCVRSAVERWKFPKPKGGGKVIVTYPFNFDPA